MAYLFKKKKISEQMDPRTNGQTNGRTVRLYYAPNFIWGHKKYNAGGKRTGAKIRSHNSGTLSWVLGLACLKTYKSTSTCTSVT